MTKISGLSEDTTPTSDDFVPGLDTTSSSTKKVKWANLANMIQGLIMPFVYPVGVIYVTTDNTNPATTFGFGTWTAYAQGQALVGVAPAGTFAGVGTVVGAETVTLDSTMIPAHTHSGGTSYVGDHKHWTLDGAGAVAIAAGSTNHLTLSGTAQQITWGATVTGAAGGHSHSFTTDGGAVGGQSHNNIQPSITVYCWKRTA